MITTPVRTLVCAWLRCAVVALGLLAAGLPARAAEPSPAEKLASSSRSTPLSPLPADRAKHLAELGVDGWHAMGALGRGVKIAVLDGGFRGYKQYLGTALPPDVTVRTFRKDGNFEGRNTQHGILCAEVVHALAPDAQLLLANWEDDDADSFLRAVKWARDEGAKIISCSIIMPQLSDGEGGGPTHAALTKLLGSDMLLFASAGNTAERHWAGPFHASSGGLHEWKPGVTDNLLTPWYDEKVSVELFCKPGSRYDLAVVDEDTGAEAARPAANGGNLVARFEPKAGHSYGVRLRLVSGPGGSFHLVALHSELAAGTRVGSVSFPADGAEVVAVGAVDHSGKRTSYSACGSADGGTKPDLVAPVPFVSSWRSRPFAGTSAAAPQAAALAALVWSRHADWTAAPVRKLLQTSARDLGIPGPDPETGFGLVHLPGAK